MLSTVSPFYDIIRFSSVSQRRSSLKKVYTLESFFINTQLKNRSVFPSKVSLRRSRLLGISRKRVKDRA